MTFRFAYAGCSSNRRAWRNWTVAAHGEDRPSGVSTKTNPIEPMGKHSPTTEQAKRTSRAFARVHAPHKAGKLTKVIAAALGMTPAGVSRAAGSRDVSPPAWLTVRSTMTVESLEKSLSDRAVPAEKPFARSPEKPRFTTMLFGQ